ncbi:7-carboxy-7-deazaguanine synthase QueE [Caviibacterium pharyngocola]
MPTALKEPIYPIVEIFESLQGEGANTGMSCIFIRFGKCNLACPWCDTNFNQFERLPLSRILQKVRSFSAKNIIITGGEPTIQPKLTALLAALKAEGYFLAIETNGLKNVPPQIDYIAVSPKRAYWEQYRRRHITAADEVRIVADENVVDFCQWVETHIRATNYYLSPCEINGEMNLLDVITQLGLLNTRRDKPLWRLSLQTHKLIGIE